MISICTKTVKLRWWLRYLYFNNIITTWNMHQFVVEHQNGAYMCVGFSMIYLTKHPFGQSHLSYSHWIANYSRWKAISSIFVSSVSSTGTIKERPHAHIISPISITLTGRKFYLWPPTRNRIFDSVLLPQTYIRMQCPILCL